MEVMTMCTWATAEAVTLDDTSEALALAHASDVDLGDVFESRDRDGLTDGMLGSILDAHFAQVAHRSDARLVEVALHGLVDFLFLDVAGYPVLDVRVELVDGSYHDVDSSEAAFKVAGSMAIKAALRKSDPVLLEPMESVEVETPQEYMGDVMGNLNSRRGQIQGQEDRGNATAIIALVPLSEMFGYATDLRSATQGRASYTMQFNSYQPVPKNVAEEIVKKAGGSAE
jgi:hypothetical protein